MAAVSTSAKIPLLLNLSDFLHQGENWKLFRCEWKLYKLAAGIHKKTQEVRVALLLNVISKEGMKPFNGKIRQTLKIDRVLEKFKEHCVPVCNETYERYIFFKREQLSNELLDSYMLTALMKLPESCEFGALCESLVHNQLILGVNNDRVCEKLLGERGLDLDKAIKTIKASQVSPLRATGSQKNFQLTKILMQWGKSQNPSTRKGRVANLPARTLPRLKSVCFVVVQMHWKGRCGQLQV